MAYKNNIAAIRQKYVEITAPNSIRSRWNNTN
jgi:hypothetical protein